VVLRPAPHKTDHFGDIPQANLSAWCRKKLKPGLVASYDIRPGNGQDLSWFRRFINLSLTYSDTYPHGAVLRAASVLRG